MDDLIVLGLILVHATSEEYGNTNHARVHRYRKLYHDGRWSGWYHCYRDSRNYKGIPRWDGGWLGDGRGRTLAAVAAGGHDEERVHMVAHD
jgi:hypothetical protein